MTAARRSAAAALVLAVSVLVSGVLAGGPAAAFWSATATTTATAAGATLLPPSSGSISAVTGTSATVRIAAAPASGPAPTSYRVLRGGTVVCTTADATLPNTCTDNGLLPGNSYGYTVISLAGTAPWISHATLALTAVTTTPSAPATPDLAAASDTGSSSADDVTAITTPVVQGATGSATAGATLYLYDNGGTTALVTTTVASDGSWSVTLPLLADGSHSLTARVGFGSGTQSAASAALVVTVDTVAPVVTLACPPPATGHRNTFAGNQSDNGRTVTVTLVPTSGTTVVLTAANPTGGSYSVTSANNQLTNGRGYSATSSQADLAGNTGSSSVCAFTAS